MADLWLKTGDTAPSLGPGPLRDGDGNAVNLTDAEVLLWMRAIGPMGDRTGGDVILDGVEVTVDDAEAGMLHYDWQDGDTDIDGHKGYWAEFEVTFDGGAVETFPNSGYITVAVLNDLGEES
jgi:hypothetical protein